VHGDLCPNNIMVSISNDALDEVNLVDFGSAYKFDEFLKVSSTTPEYLAPELIIFKESIADREPA
jgi:serine/threonine protein kinase